MLLHTMLELDFEANLCEAFAEDKKQHYCGDLVWDVELFKRLFFIFICLFIADTKSIV